MNKELKDFFEKKGFEVVEKKTTTQILLQNLLAFSVREKKGGLFDISINLVKEPEEKEKLRSRSQGFEVNFKGTPTLLGVSFDEFEKLKIFINDFLRRSILLMPCSVVASTLTVQLDWEV